jgi:hypothetical protein
VSAYSAGLTRDWIISVIELMIADGLRGNYGSGEKKGEEKSATAPSSVSCSPSHYHAITTLTKLVYAPVTEKKSKTVTPSSADEDIDSGSKNTNDTDTKSESKEAKSDGKEEKLSVATSSLTDPSLSGAQLEAVAAFLPSIAVSAETASTTKSPKTSGGKVGIPSLPKITYDGLLERSVLKPLNISSTVTSARSSPLTLSQCRALEALLLATTKHTPSILDTVLKSLLIDISSSGTSLNDLAAYLYPAAVLLESAATITVSSFAFHI